MSSAQFGKYQRAEAAQQNGFENIALYASAIVAANVARVPVSFVNAASAYYVFSRIVYNLLYINTERLSTSNLRSIVFVSSIVTCVCGSPSCRKRNGRLGTNDGLDDFVCQGRQCTQHASLKKGYDYVHAQVLYRCQTYPSAA